MQWPESPGDSPVPVHELIGLIYEAAEDPELWPVLLVGLIQSVQDGQEIAQPGLPQLHPPQENERSFSELMRLNGDELSETLVPHFQRALRLNRRLAEALQHQERALDILEHLPLGVILADESAMPRAMNSRARTLLERSDVLKLRQQRLVANTSFQDTVALQDLIRTAVVNREGGGTLSLEADTPVSLMVMPCGNAPDEATVDACCTIFIATHELEGCLDTEVLRTLFGLSPAEARLTQALVQGHSIEQAARELHISPHTARTQLKAVFAKTGTRRQPELMRKVLTSPAVLARPPGESPPSLAALPPVTDHFLTLRDGRRLCYAEHGDPDGTPVLFFHSIVGSRLQIHPDTDLVQSMGLRWIVPERPGFGRSDPMPGRRFRDWTEDVGELADHLGLERFHLAGFSAGGSHALACAWAMPERVIRTALISPMAPFTSLSVLNGMPPTNRMLLAMAHYAPALLGPFMRIMLQGLIRNPEQITSRHVELWPEADRQAMNRPGTREHMVGIYREAVRQGPDALVHEQLLLARDWDFDPAEVKGPVDIWHGDADIHVPFTMLPPLRQIPDHRLHVIPERGHYLLLDYWRDIFETLTASA